MPAVSTHEIRGRSSLTNGDFTTMYIWRERFREYVLMVVEGALSLLGDKGGCWGAVCER